VSVIKPLLQARNAGPRADDRTVLYFLAAGDRVALATSRRAKTAHGCAKGLHLAHVNTFFIATDERTGVGRVAYWLM
jgi:hypothetical protein